MNNDPFRRLAHASAVLCACGINALPHMWDAADGAFTATEWNERDLADDVGRLCSERTLREAYTLSKMCWTQKPARDLLWAAVQLYGIFRSSRHDIGVPEATPNYWWQEI